MRHIKKATAYFARQRRKDTDRPTLPSKCLSDAALLVHIKATHASSKGEYGWPRIRRELRANGVRIWKERVRRLMKEHGIKARGKRKFVVTTDSKHSLPIASNLLNRNFQPEAPDHVRTSDITYNAPTESLWGSLKVGRFYGMRIETRRQVMDEVIDWLTYYNHRRLHSILDYVSPMQFERNWFAAQLKKVA